MILKEYLVTNTNCLSKELSTTVDISPIQGYLTQHYPISLPWHPRWATTMTTEHHLWRQTF